ncbi:hypothetical protein RMATCC62417_14176 [Rhizopus microsporus]|nr:hypothetical protein RMATCC62417_14176 [Rhizopus microsporus]
MSGILVFQRKGDYDDLPTDLFPSTLLTAARKETLAKYKRGTFQPYVRLALQSIIQRFVDENTTEIQAKSSFYHFANRSRNPRHKILLHQLKTNVLLSWQLFPYYHMYTTVT